MTSVELINFKMAEQIYKGTRDSIYFPWTSITIQYQTYE
jgi:hypothetical protein